MPKQINSFSGKNDKGFTLVEILVSLVILLILVVAFVPMFTFVAQAISNNQAKDTATALANKAIEDIRSLPFIVLDKETGLVVTDPNVPQLGIKNDAECPGSIPAQQILLIKDKTYTVDTQIVWVDNMYKKVSVSVEYLSAFNNKEVVSNFYTIASEEGELKTSLTGNILVKILNKDGNHFDGASIDVKVFDAEGIEISSGTTVDGERLFEELEIGSYVVSVRVGSLAHSPDQTIVDGWLVLNKQVTSDDTTIAAFYLDQPGALSITLQDNSNNYIVGNGIIQLSWTNGETIQNFPPFSFGINDFTNNILSADTIKAKLDNVNLWPGGNYSITLTDVFDKSTMRTYTTYQGSEFELPAGKTTNNTIKHFTKANSLLSAHFDANGSADTPTENRVTLWRDKTGDWYADSSSRRRPLQESNVLNGHSVMRFQTKNVYNNPTKFTLHKYVGSSEFTNNFTIVVVAKSITTHDVEAQSNSGTSGTSGQKYLLGPTQKGNNAGCGLSLGTNGVSNYEHGNSYMPPTAVYSGTLSSFNVIALKYITLPGTNPKADIYINGQLKTDGVPSARSTVYTPTIIGGDNDNYGNFDGDLAMLLIYNTPLNDANIQLLSDILKNHYAL